MSSIRRSGIIKRGSLLSFFCGLSFLMTRTCLALAAQAPLEIPLTIQEAIYADAPTKGIARDQGPVTVGIPLADSAAIKDVSQLGLKGASAGQFRVLGRWPSGNIQWLLIDTQASLGAGRTNTSISVVAGHGNFGGPDLAHDDGAAISINTGPSQFAIRKANFDLFDRVVVNGKILVDSGASAGLVLMGPDTTISVAAPPPPSSSATSGGGLGERRYSVRISYATISGETEGSQPAMAEVPAGRLLTVSSPPSANHVVGYYVYAAKPGNNETLQTPRPVPIGQSWAEPDTGISSDGRKVSRISGVGTGCGTCNVEYSSKNDARSTAVIEENGPVRTVIKADGTHFDRSGHAYMHYTVRMYFYKGKSYAKVEVILRNADEPKNPRGVFNSAYKGFASYEARLTPALAGTKTFRIAGDRNSFGGMLHGAVSGSFHGGEDAYLYQAYSDDLEPEDWGGANNCAGPIDRRCVASYIARTRIKGREYSYAQDGYQIVQGDSVLAHGDHTKYPQGWADLSDSSGAGVEVGVYQLAGYWPKSLQFMKGGSEVRVGIWPDQSLFHGGYGQPYYQAWPQYSVHDLFFDFHGAALNSPADDFLSFQHYLLARAPLSQYNDSGALFYPLLEPSAEDRYYKSANVPCCLMDKPPKIFRRYDWPGAGAGNQHELRWSYLRNFLQRGLTGRYLFAANFYRMVVEQSFPRSDGFVWRNHPLGQLGYEGFPDEILSANGSLAHRDWIDTQHAHWYGMTLYYFVTGDETVKDQLLNGIKDRFLNLQSKANTGKLWEARDVGGQLMGIAHLYRALSAMGDPDAAKLIPVAETTLKTLVFPELNLSGFGTGDPVPGIDGSHGISRTRGVQYGCCNRADEKNYTGRLAAPFRHAILVEGMYELAQTLGPEWRDYNLVMDLAYGASRWALTEGWGAPPGQTPNDRNSGVIFELHLDGGNEDNHYYQSPGAGQTNWFNFFIPVAYAGDLTWKKNFDLLMQRVSTSGQKFFAEYGSHMLQAVISETLNPPPRLVTVPITAKNNGNGSYTLSWTVPPGVIRYRMKYAIGKDVVDWIGFNPGTNNFSGDPNHSWAWFACTEIAGVPAPTSSGTAQSFVFKGEPGKDYRFALKAYISSH